MLPQRRKRSRIRLEIPLLIICTNKDVRGTVHDLSLKGLACVTEDRVVLGQECELVLELDSGIKICIVGRIVRVDQDCAIDFIRMDEVSFGHLRNLIRLYAEDADLVDEELRRPAFTLEP